MKKNVLLLNPPGKDIYIRDYYCSKISKGDYIYHPVDLLVLSGWLNADFNLKVMDCIVTGISAENATRQIKEFAPDAIIFLTGAVSKDEDFAFLKQLKNETNALVLGTGDYLLEDFESIKSEAPWLDAIILDFSNDDTLTYLQKELLNKNDGKKTDTVIDLHQDVSAVKISRQSSGNCDFPVPRYELFPNELYTYPFVTRLPFATVLTNYGCPFKCNFCVMSGLGFKQRTLDNVTEELDTIKSLGFKDIYFSDQTFGAHKAFTRNLCRTMVESKYGFKWVGFTRVDLITEEILDDYKTSGCHMLMFGVELPQQDMQAKFHKDLNMDQVENAFKLCKKKGIRTLATFIIGLPGTSYDQNLQILDYALKIDPDYASFNVWVPRKGTDFYKMAKDEEWINNDQSSFDQSGNFANIKTDLLSSEKIQELKQIIDKKFYMRPKYILKRLFDIRSYHEAKLLFSNGCALLSGLLAK